jgi:two-component system chemotaxis response regulator CheB
VGVRVVVCEDSPTYRRALVRALEHGGELEVVGAFETAEATLAALDGLTPDLITMDLELPGMQGLAAVEEIMGAHPIPVAVVSSHVGGRSEAAGAALAAGAVEALAKDDLDLLDPAGLSAAALRRRLQLLSRARVVRHPRARLRATGRPPTRRLRAAAAIGMCASTGGPQALTTLLRELPADFPLPVLVVQHMSAGFLEGFAQWLVRSVALPVRLARDGAPIERGVTLAPEGAHLLLTAERRLHLDREGPAQAHRPSGDALLRSLADVTRSDTVGVVLTGMGHDGAAGVAAIRAAGGLTIAQDEASSAIYGMPRAAVEQGAELVLPLADIATTLTRLRETAR